MRLGFYNYDQAVVGVDGVVFKDSLRGGSTPAGTSDVGTPTWSDAGLVSGISDGVGFATTTTANTKLDVEGTFQFMVSKEALSCELEDISAISGNWVGVGNPAFILSKTNNASPSRGTHGHNKPFRGVNLPGRLASGAQLNYFGSPYGWDFVDNKVEVIITWDGGGIDVYVDRFRIMSVPWTINMPLMSANAYLGSIGSGGLPLTFSEALITTQKTVLPNSILSARNVHIYGDSYPKQGQYQPHSTLNYQASAYDAVTENGVNVLTIDGIDPATYTGIYNGVTGVTCNMDAGVFPILHRKLNKRGIYTPEIRNWTQGGSGMQATGGGLGETIPVRVTKSLGYAVPDIAVFIYGYNDGSLNAGAGPSDLAAYKVLHTDMIDALLVANPDMQIVFCNAVYNDHASFIPNESAITNINGVIDEVVGLYSNVRMANAFGGFGGFNAAADTYFQTDHIHPNTLGQSIMGRLVAEKIY